MPFAARFEQGSGGGNTLPLRLAFRGREGRSHSRGVAVVGVSGVFVRFNLEEGGEWWKISPSVSCFEGERDVAEEWWVLMVFVVRFEEGGSGGKKYTPSPSRVSSEGGTCVAGSRIDVRCDEEGFTPPLATSKMAFDMTRRGETLLVTSMCLQRLGTSQYNEIIHLKKYTNCWGWA